MNCGRIADGQLSNQIKAGEFALKSQYFSQKNPRVRKIRVRNSGAGNGCANFMDA